MQQPSGEHRIPKINISRQTVAEFGAAIPNSKPFIRQRDTISFFLDRNKYNFFLIKKGKRKSKA